MLGAEIVIIQETDSIITVTTNRFCNLGIFADNAGAARSTRIEYVEFDELVSCHRVRVAVWPDLASRKSEGSYLFQGKGVDTGLARLVDPG